MSDERAPSSEHELKREIDRDLGLGSRVTEPRGSLLGIVQLIEPAAVRHCALQ